MPLFKPQASNAKFQVPNSRSQVPINFDEKAKFFYVFLIISMYFHVFPFTSIYFNLLPRTSIYFYILLYTAVYCCILLYTAVYCCISNFQVSSLSCHASMRVVFSLFGPSLTRPFSQSPTRPFSASPTRPFSLRQGHPCQLCNPKSDHYDCKHA